MIPTGKTHYSQCVTNSSTSVSEIHDNSMLNLGWTFGKCHSLSKPLLIEFEDMIIISKRVNFFLLIPKD